MTVRSTFCCACVIGILLLSNVCFGALYQDGGTDNPTPTIYDQGVASTTTNESFASARGATSYPYSTAIAGGWNEMYTTTAGYFAWGYNIDAYATFTLNFGLPSSTVYGQGVASAGALSPNGSDGVAADAGHSDTASSGSIGWPDDPPSSSDSGFDYFGANDGIYAEHTSSAAASVTLPSGGDGYGRSDADASCGMY
jgi:hypothetical protein